MNDHNINEEFATGPPGRGLKGRQRGFVSSITIDGTTYGSLGIFSTKERAEFFAAKGAWEGINQKKGTYGGTGPHAELFVISNSYEPLWLIDSNVN